VFFAKGYYCGRRASLQNPMPPLDVRRVHMILRKPSGARDTSPGVWYERLSGGARGSAAARQFGV
jgi:hypothetical protein